MFNIKEELKNLPNQPGVYIMHDSNNDIIYVGKAKILKNRVRQYFQSSKNHPPKVRAMVKKISYFEYIVTDSEVEALVLECNLIKKYKPKYNILLKDDKQYPYIKVTINEDYPKVFMTRTLKNDGAKYFGPYMGSNTIKNTLDIIQKIFSPPVCKRKFPQDIGKGRPCLNYHIKKCFAPCTGNVSKEEYKQIFLDICEFLQDDHKNLIKSLEQQMNTASLALEYEKAALIRDKIQAINSIDQKQKIIMTDSLTDKDVIALSRGDSVSFIEVFFIRGGKVIGRENYHLDDTLGLTNSEIMTGFFKRFYSDAVNLPQEILLEYDIEDKEVFEDWLRKKNTRKISITVPKRGEKLKLIEMVRKNANIERDNYDIRVLKQRKGKVIKDFSDMLGIVPPKRIEAYDISNISGNDSVGAMVVFEDEKPQNKKYRHFKIKSVEGADDYASTKEVIYRRFKRALDEQDAVNKGELLIENAKFLPIPDLILADGGKGHVGAICEMLEQLELEIPVFGMVKDSKHRTRGLITSQNEEIEINPLSNVFHFITRIQDEVHRFAISYFRKLHAKNAIKSQLDEIKGIGEKRRKKLLETIGSVDKIKNCTVEELAEVIGKAAANNVYTYFHNKI